ncbi:WD repeat and SOCS box-containing protein 2 isoform X2 [Anabas testudineus]|uniref:WD repeat and SOCS box-containing protein 2 isoform X2 n=1 Tax=Anabas testudineus TaxID=64144 RepID=UPI000E45E67D|nr:WD repeat and SOCS box-containing protein 2 isoform X2 [Anabas testudineus]
MTTCSPENDAEPQRSACSPLVPILELKTRHPPSEMYQPGCENRSVDFSPDGAWFAWSKGHGVVWVVPWPLDFEHGEKTEADLGDKKFRCGERVWGLAFGPRPPKSAAETQPAKTPSKWNDSLLLATGLHDGVIKIWNVLTGCAVFDLHGHSRVVRDLVFPQNGTLTLISCSRDRTLRIWDLAEKGKKVQVLSGHKDWISCCAVSPDCSMVASVGQYDRMVCLWSLRSYTLIRNLNGEKSGEKHKTLCIFSSCDFSPDGALLATTSLNYSDWWIDLWDPYTAEKLATLFGMFPGYGEPTYSAIKFSPSGLELVMASEQLLYPMWKPEKRMVISHMWIRPLYGPLCCSYHPSGGVVAAGTRTGNVSFFRVPSTVPSLRHLCRSVLRHSVSTYEIEALPLPKKLLKYLTYRNLCLGVHICYDASEHLVNEISCSADFVK